MQADLSVIIPYFNNKNTIQRCLESVFSQTLLPKEIIIINDGSPKILENEILKKENININITIINNENNNGASYARNFGIKKATAKYIAFLDADDAWFYKKIETQYNYMINSRCKISCHIYDHTYKENKENKLSIKILNKYSFLFKNQVHTPTVMALKESFIPFDTRLKRMEDYKCWIENSIENKIHKILISLAYGFKPPIGYSGLSASLVDMHQDCLKSIKLLHQDKKINKFQYYLSFLFEKFKYPIRIFLVKLKNH